MDTQEGTQLVASRLSYRVEIAMLGIMMLDEEHIPVTIPVNSRLFVVESNERASDPLLRVAEWDAKQLLIFVQELRNRATLITGDTDS